MLESSVCFPTNVRFAEEPPTKSDPDDVAVELYYTAQMFLRSRLNEMHVSLYGAKSVLSHHDRWDDFTDDKQYLQPSRGSLYRNSRCKARPWEIGDTSTNI